MPVAHDSADTFGDFVVGLKLREHFLGGGGVVGDLLGIRQLGDFRRCARVRGYAGAS